MFFLAHFTDAHCQERYPHPAAVAQPGVPPPLESAGYQPPFHGSPHKQAPVCAAWSRTAGPDESIVLTGEKMTSNASDYDCGTRFRIYGNGTLKDAFVQRLDSQKAVITINSGFAEWDMYTIWPGNDSGFGRPIFINRTEAWWLGPDKGTKGGVVSVFGRNLSYKNDTLTSHVYLRSAAGKGWWATVANVNPYKVDFLLPPDIEAGTCEVWVHNGHGGSLGWSEPLKLTVAGGSSQSKVILNVKQYGAKGNGVEDDTKALSQAVQIASRRPGTVLYFPAGVYVVNNTLYLSGNVTYKGDGASSIIRCGPSFSSNAWGMLHAQNKSNFVLQDLTLDANNNFKGKTTNPIYFRADENVRISNVRFLFTGYHALDLNNSKHVFVSYCLFIGKQSFLGTCSQLFVDHCTFKLTNDADMALHSWGGIEISVTNSTCSDYDNYDPRSGKGWGRGRFFVGNGNWGSSRFVYLANNTTTDLVVRPVGVDQNAGEQILWEGNYTAWSGKPSLSTETTTVCPGFRAGNMQTQFAVVVKGKGLGQSRRILFCRKDTLTLESPWNVVPDATSVINIGAYIDKIVVYKNYIDGKTTAVVATAHNASAGIQPYGGCLNFIADGNTLHELRQGISNWVTRNNEDKGMEPNFFSLFANNRIVGCRWGILNAEGSWNSSLNAPEGTGMLGAVYRKNIVDAAIETGVKNTIRSTGYPIIEGMVYEYNTIANTPVSLQVDGENTGNCVFYKNNF